MVEVYSEASKSVHAIQIAGHLLELLPRGLLGSMARVMCGIHVLYSVQFLGDRNRHTQTLLAEDSGVATEEVYAMEVYQRKKLEVIEAKPRQMRSAQNAAESQLRTMV